MPGASSQLTLFSSIVLCQQAQSEARTEASGTINRYCVTCHNASTRAAGLVLDPADLNQIGAKAEVWEKVLRQLRGATMPPPGSSRPDAAVYSRMSSFLARELEANAAARPNPGNFLLRAD